MNSVKNLRYKLGQLFIIGFEGESISSDSPIVGDITKRNLGGVILFDQLLAKQKKSNNITGKQQLVELTKKLQQSAQGTLLICVDQEGGMVNRFKKERGFPVTPSAQQLGSTHGTSQTASSAKNTARLLREVGVNCNFAPAVDLNINRDNPVIGKVERSFSADPAIVQEHALAWIKAHIEEKILYCLKHFPGHGSSQTDSHQGFVDITNSWQKTEIEPFIQLYRRGYAPAIMVGHLFNSFFDPDSPATLSYHTIGKYLRNALGYDGLVVSDDMQMKAITDHYSIEDACCKAIAAGIDLLILGNNLDHDPQILQRVLEALVQAVESGEIPEKRIENSWHRVQQFKQLWQVVNANS